LTYNYTQEMDDGRVGIPSSAKNTTLKILNDNCHFKPFLCVLNSYANLEHYFHTIQAFPFTNPEEP